MWHSRAGPDGPARRSISVGRTWRTGPPPSSFAAGCRGPRQDGQAAKTKLLRRSCWVWTKAWGQREFADKRTGHLKSPTRLQDSFKGGLDIPPTHVQFSLLRRKHPIWTLDHRSGSRNGRERIAVFAHMALSWFKRRRPWFINWSNNALATVPFPSGMVGRYLKPQFRAQHERPGFLTARNHVRRPLGLALVDEPMAQLHGCATHV